MSTRRFDPELAARTERQLAAVTDGQLVEDIRAAAQLVYELAELCRRTHDSSASRAAYEAAKATQTALGELEDSAAVDGAVAAVGPVLGFSWPTAPRLAAAAAVAVEQLRDAAMHRPSLVRQCRQLVDADLGQWASLLPASTREPGEPRRPSEAEAAAYGLWLDLTMGLMPALELAEIRPGEVREELEVALASARVGERGWGSLGRALRETLEAGAALVDAGEPALAARLLHHPLARLRARAGDYGESRP